MPPLLASPRAYAAPHAAPTARAGPAAPQACLGATPPILPPPASPRAAGPPRPSRRAVAGRSSVLTTTCGGACSPSQFLQDCPLLRVAEHGGLQTLQVKVWSRCSMECLSRALWRTSFSCTCKASCA
ncbi:hypothetical protein ACP70R_026303 [Stipagrostis hirtigluma subsp. patula]